VGADRRQGAVGLDRAPQPLVARSAVRRRPRADHPPAALAEGTTFQIDFDFLDHYLAVSTSEGALQSFPLADGSAYRAGATLGGWDRTELESVWCPEPPELSALLAENASP
jgi:hypothetical protein